MRHRGRDVPQGRKMSGLYTRQLRRAGHYRWFALSVKHVFSRVDRALIRASRGRLTLGGPQMSMMLLTTKGRSSGKDRTVPVYYIRDGENLVAACS
jgi:F420H(2)-dependent quinone reductase